MYQRPATRRDVRIAAQRMGRFQRVQPPQTVVLPSPVGGLNGRDALDDMEPEDAVVLDNWYPGFGKVEVRKGTADWATVGLTSGAFTASSDPVETLAVLELSTGATMIAACGDAIYDVTAGGDELDTPLDDGFTSAQWQHAAMNDVLGLVNGADAPQTYNGTALAAMTVAAAMGESESLTASDLIGINVYRNRSYLWRDHDAGFWFSAVNALGGDLEYFPLGDVHGVGGKLVTMVSWTRDGGEGGVEDLAVFLMSSGQAVLYAGSDPGSADDWSLVGVFSIGRLIGVRSVVKIGGEAIILTVDGYTALSRVLPGGRTASDVQISDKLGKIVLDVVRINGSSFGWQAIHYPRGRRLIVNYPNGGAYEQHVANLSTGAWCRFRGMEARCWATFNDRLFFGTSGGQVLEADVGTSDRGAIIQARGQLAFSTLRGAARNKRVTAMRPLLEATGSLTATLSLYADYSPVPAATVEAEFPALGGGGGKWNTFKWNTTPWASPSKAVQGWVGHGAHGYTISPEVRVEQRNDLIAWSGTGLMYEQSGIM